MLICCIFITTRVIKHLILNRKCLMSKLALTTAILFWFWRFSLPGFSFEYVSIMCIQFRTNSAQVGIVWILIKIMLNNGLYHNKSVFV